MGQKRMSLSGENSGPFKILIKTKNLSYEEAINT